MITEEPFRLTSLASCAGCAAKMGSETLSQVLRPLAATFGAMASPELLVGLGAADDAAVYRLSDDLALVATLDFFPPVVDDPFTFGMIAATNALNDVYSMGGRPVLALNITTFPADLDPQILTEILRGGAEAARKAGAVVAGGHTVLDPEPKYGLAVIGTINPRDLVTKGGAEPGDVLIITKPIGTGIITTAHKRELINQNGPELARCLSWMTAPNGDAMAVTQSLQRAGAISLHAGTDVTGFSLLGHAWEMLSAQQPPRGLRLSMADLPLMEGARDLAEAGAIPGGTARNLSAIAAVTDWGVQVTEVDRSLVCDPQTAGGLLLAVPEPDAETLITALTEANLSAWRIGSVTDSGRMEVN